MRRPYRPEILPRREPDTRLVKGGVKTIATRQIELAAPLVAATYGDSAKLEALNSSEGFVVEIKAAKLGEATLAAANLTNWRLKRNTEGLVHITIPLSGHIQFRYGAREVHTSSQRQALVARPFESITHNVARGVGLAFYAPVEALVGCAERLTGGPQSVSLIDRLVDHIDLEAPVGAMLARNMRMVMDEMSNAQSLGIGAVLAADYESLLLNLATVSLFPTVAQTLGEVEADGGPASVRRARDYIREHAAEPIEISQLAKDLGVGMRMLQLNFQKHFGYSARDYILECRLENAKQTLSQGDPASSVTQAAIDCGFGDLSHFSLKYRERFSELPSETLRAARNRFS